MPEPYPHNPLPFDEAIAWAGARGVVLPDVYYGQLQGLARSTSFSIAGLSSLDQLQQVLDSLTEAMETGETLRSWQNRVSSNEIALDLPAHRLENIFRTNIQSHYARGRCEQQRRNIENRPWLLYDAVNDSRTRPSHAAMDGFVARYDDPIWQQWSPPAGYQCVLPGTRVSGDFKVGLKAIYAGKAIEIITAEGIRLAVTANHPVLTSSGWMPAKDIKEGDNLLSYKTGEERRVDALAISRSERFSRVVDNQDAPPLAEDVFDALSTQRLGTLPRSTFNLYGDALSLKSEVYVAGADGELIGATRLPGQIERSGNLSFKVGNHGGSRIKRIHLDPARTASTSSAGKVHPKHAEPGLDEWLGNIKAVANLFARKPVGKKLLQFLVKVNNGAPPGAIPSRAALALDKSPVSADIFPFESLGFTSPAKGDSLTSQPIAKRLSAYTQAVGKRIDAFATFVAGNNLFRLIRLPSQRFNGTPASDPMGVLQRSAFDPSFAQKTTKEAVADAPLFQHLAHRCARQVQIDKVVGVRDFSFRGHVYDFESENGLIAANGIITSNCRCRRIALTEKQAERFRSADERRMQRDTEALDARMTAITGGPDEGWDYDICSEPTEGLRRAIERRQNQNSATNAATPLWQTFVALTLGALLVALVAATAIGLSEKGGVKS